MDVATGQVEDKAEDGKNPAAVTDRLQEIVDIAALISAREGPPKKRGPYEPWRARAAP